MTTTRRTLLGLLPVLALGSAAARGSTPLSIVATTGMIADAARVIGGAAVDVRALMGPGIDPHSYRQTRTDIVALARAELVLWHGLYLEAQMEEFLLDLAARQPVVAVAESLPEARLIGHEDYAGRRDPHVWMDPTLWAGAVTRIRDALSEVRPDEAADFDARAAAYLAELDRLARYSTDVLSSVPEQARVLVTAHDAFRYFGAAYGYEVVGIQGISTESEAGLARIGELVDMLVERRIGAAFVESTVSDRNIRALIEGAAAKGHTVRIGGELYSDAMGPDGSYEGTYLGMIDHNVSTIAAALGGSVPERGMDGRLSRPVEGAA
ncbi:zinc ABC transporter solute-binding protein [Halovulum dunhuangense]|uniref:Zinc ABC transporter solute-binding protein n=1 Tax=Halovulum dunhuangense TaxID=1505036 RepID=A0A849L5K5_9RHOB|nr:zinc ABC transporter substrate-binding protein [Halovulum dunhuangense]NNU81659.1 zinc ABC transporter solute-binding protein [Halovulum dunhuangense]